MDKASGVYLHITDSSFITDGASNLVTVIPMMTVKGKIGINDVTATTSKDILGYDMKYNSNYYGLEKILEKVSHAYVWRLNQNAKLANAYFVDTASEEQYDDDAEAFEDITKLDPAPILAIAHTDVGDWETAAVKFVPTEDVQIIVNNNATAAVPQTIVFDDINTTEMRNLFEAEILSGCIFYNSSDNSVVGIIKKNYEDEWKVYRVVDGEIVDDVIETITTRTNTWSDGVNFYNGNMEVITEPAGEATVPATVGIVRTNNGLFYQKIESNWYEAIRFTTEGILLADTAVTDTGIIDALEAASDVTISYIQYTETTTEVKEIKSIGGAEFDENKLTISLIKNMSADSYWSVHTLPSTLVNWTAVYASYDGRNYNVKSETNFSFDIESDIYIEDVDFGDIQIFAPQTFDSTWTAIRDYITLKGGSNGDKVLNSVDIDVTQLDDCSTKPNVMLMNGFTDYRIVNRLANRCIDKKIHMFVDAPAFASYSDLYAWSKKVIQSEYVAIGSRPDQSVDSEGKPFYIYPSVNYAKIFAEMLNNYGSLCYPPAGASYGTIEANDLLKCDYANFADEMKTYRLNWQMSDANGTVMWEQRTTYALNTDLSYIAPVFIVDDLADQIVTFERMFNFRYMSRTDLLNQESGITDILDGFVSKGFISRYEMVVPSYDEAQKAGRTLTIKIGVAIAKDSEVINIELELLSA